MSAQNPTSTSLAEKISMRIPSIYDLIGYMDILGKRITSILTRSSFDMTSVGTREGVYALAKQRFDYLVPNEDMVNLAPLGAGEPLHNVQPGDEVELRALGAVERDGTWFMPITKNEQSKWKFKKWFPRAPKDLEVSGSTMKLTADGRSTNGYILPVDEVTGGDSTATSLVMAAFPVLFALSMVLWGIPYIGPILVMTICVPLIALHIITLWQAEDAGTVARVVALSGGVPFLMFGTDLTQGGVLNLSGMTTMKAIGIAVGVVVLAMLFKTEDKNQTQSFFTRLRDTVLALAAVAAFNYALALLPSSLDIFKPIGVFIIACAYPLYYTKQNYLDRAALLKNQSIALAGKQQSRSSILGPTAPIRRQQIISAARDSSPFMPIGVADGEMAKYNLAIAPEPGQEIGYTLEDSRTHTIFLGLTGKGKTAKGLRPYMLNLSKVSVPIGAIGADGKGSLIGDTRPWWDIIIEPGVKFGPFQGMNSLQVAEAFAEANNESMDDKNSIWVKGAGTLHRNALAVLEALVEHQRNYKKALENRLEYIAHELEYLLADRELKKRAGADVFEIDAQISTLHGLALTTKKEVEAPPVYRWTPASYAKLKNILCQVVMGKGGVKRANEKTIQLFEYLGYDSSAYRAGDLTDQEIRVDKNVLALDPAAVHPHLHDPTRVLSQALDYFLRVVPSMEEQHLSSYSLNVDEDILGFFQNDELRGSLIDGVDHGDEAWSNTEHGVDVLQALHGKKVGINLSNKYGKTGRVIYQLIKMRLYNAIRQRQETYGDDWMEKTGQTLVYAIYDECQDLISPIEDKLIAQARSMGLSFVCATQTIESLNPVLPTQDDKSRFLSNFRSIVLFECSEKTYEFVQGAVGKAEKKKIPIAVEATIDTTRAIEVYRNSIFKDPNHPNSVALRDLDRRGAARFQVVVRGMKHYMGLSRKVPIEEVEGRNYIEVHAGGEYVEGPILELHEMTANLMIEGKALVVLNRAGHRRIDFAKLPHITPKAFVQKLEEIRKRKTEQPLAA